MFPEPIIFLGLPIHLFGLFLILGIVTSYLAVHREMARLKLPVDTLPDLSFAILTGAFLGARLLFILFHWGSYFTNPIGIFKVWTGGLVLYGGVLGGLIGGLIFCKKQKLPFAKFADVVAFGLPLGFGIGRLGCLAAGCCYGKPTASLWGIIFHNPLAIARPLEVSLHPTQIYSLISECFIFLILFYRRDKKTFSGEILLTFLLLETATRFGIEFFRAESHFATFLIAILIFAVSFICYIQLKNKNKGGIMKMKSAFKLAIPMAAIFFFAACGIISTQEMHRGHDIEHSDVNTIVKGRTTETEVVKVFGPPTKVRDTDQGKELFYEYEKTGGFKWNFVLSIGGGTVTKTLLVWLDKNGVVTDYAFKTT